MTQLFGAGMPFHHGLFHAEKKKVKRACGNGNKSAMRGAGTLTGYAYGIDMFWLCVDKTRFFKHNGVTCL